MQINLDTPIDQTLEATEVHLIAFAITQRRDFIVRIRLVDINGDTVNGARIVLTDTQADTLVNNSTGLSNIIARIFNQLKIQYPGAIVS